VSADIIVALIGVGGGLGGALAGGFIAYKTLLAQLRHRAQEKERERQLTLRRDVYLEAMEAIGKSQTLLGSFSREDFDIPKLLDKLEEIPGALVKAQLVTSERTFEALDRFGDFMVSSCLALLGLHLRVRHLQRAIGDRQRQISQLQQRYDNLHTFLQQVNPQGSLHAKGISELQRIQSEIPSLHAILQKLTQRNVELTEHLGREAVKATLDAQAEVGRVTIQIRSELELPLKEAWYMERLEKRRDRLLTSVDQAYKDVDDIFGETEALEASVDHPVPPTDSQGRC
jgi:hypothetical protein